MTKKRLSQLSEDYRRIEQAIKFIEANFKSRPDLSNLLKPISSHGLILMKSQKALI